MAGSCGSLESCWLLLQTGPLLPGGSPQFITGVFLNAVVAGSVLVSLSLVVFLVGTVIALCYLGPILAAAH